MGVAENEEEEEEEEGRRSISPKAVGYYCYKGFVVWSILVGSRPTATYHPKYPHLVLLSVAIHEHKFIYLLSVQSK